MRRRRALWIVLVGLLLGPQCSIPLGGGYSAPERFMLDPAGSHLWFVGIKNNAVAVPGSFAELAGALDVTGHRGWIQVQLASLATGDAKRDESIATHLFNAADYPVARFAIKDATGASELPPPGGSVELKVTGLLTLRGIETPLEVPVRLTRSDLQRIRVTTTAPFVLTKQQLQLEQAFKVLQAVCGHEALSGAVPIQFDLAFNADG